MCLGLFLATRVVLYLEVKYETETPLFIQRGMKPENWDVLSENEKTIWKDLEITLVAFFSDLKKERLILPEPYVIRKNLQTILNYQQELYNVSLVIQRICSPKRGTIAFVTENTEFNNGNELLNWYLSYFGFMIIQAHELFRNILLNTLNTGKMTNKKGKPIGKRITKWSLIKLLDYLKNKKITDKTEDLKILFLGTNQLRNAFAHGLFWFEFPNIFWLDNITTTEPEHIEFGAFMTLFRELNIRLECTIWVSSQLFKENFFKP